MSMLLKCNSVEETKSFYAQLLGFDVSDSTDDTCTVQKEGGSIIFTESDLWDGYPHCTGTIYFFLPDVDDYYGTVKANAIIRWPLETMSYGMREFGLKDCNGYILAFASRN